jgi:hypothetical protein
MLDNPASAAPTVGRRRLIDGAVGTFDGAA